MQSGHTQMLNNRNATMESEVRKQLCHQQQTAKLNANCIIIAPKRLKLRLSGQLENRQNGFETRRGSNFRPFWLEPFLSRSVEKRGDQFPNSNAEKWPIIMQFAAAHVGVIVLVLLVELFSRKTRQRNHLRAVQDV
eukprot:COSAG06_NODE_9194_length_1960_cov_9.463729_2_plen_136_part_00